uniref:Uncharacterized protein n=1 Tax=Timema tahoe TaxID=61484 RepID=A0A7R9IKW0_9NEOP|nr:unnamed protein product [Timema tahoe]
MCLVNQVFVAVVASEADCPVLTVLSQEGHRMYTPFTNYWTFSKQYFHTL